VVEFKGAPFVFSWFLRPGEGMHCMFGLSVVRCRADRKHGRKPVQVADGCMGKREMKRGDINRASERELSAIRLRS